MPQLDETDESCCGPPAGSKAIDDEQPGYTICHFVDGFVNSRAGRVPRVKEALEYRDVLGTLRARVNIGRNNYRIAPGLYCIGEPDESSPVLVTANYKLSFDALRKELFLLSAWIIVLDTRGINVWCAAGKGTFSTQEIVRQVKLTGIEKLVSKKELIVPQLGATGVSAKEVKKACGFKVIWGPVRAKDLKQFIYSGKMASPEMRQVTFTLKERLELIPVELSLAIKPLMWTLLAVFILSGIGPGFFSLTSAFDRSIIAAVTLIASIVAGAFAAPVFLQWIPGSAFSIKGAITGMGAGLLAIVYFRSAICRFEAMALFFSAVAVSSYLSMNFTGTTPFTSPSGVEKEMRKSIPIQAVAVLLAAIGWLAAPFYG